MQTEGIIGVPSGFHLGGGELKDLGQLGGGGSLGEGA